MKSKCVGIAAAVFIEIHTGKKNKTKKKNCNCHAIVKGVPAYLLHLSLLLPGNDFVFSNISTK